MAESLPGAGAVIAAPALTALAALAANVIGCFVACQITRVFNALPLVKRVYGSTEQIVVTMSNPADKTPRKR